MSIDAYHVPTDPSVHVLHVTPSLGTGGIERLVFELARRRSESGGRVSVGVLWCPEQGDQGFDIHHERTRELRSCGVQVATLGSGLRGTVGSARRLRSFAWTGGPVDVAHAHSLAGLLAVRGSLVRVPVVWTLHNTTFNFPRSALRLTDPLVDRYVGCSPTVTRVFSRHTRHRIQTIVNGVDLSGQQCTSDEGSSPEEVVRVIAVGALRQQKRYDRLVRAFGLASRSLRGLGIASELMIVGDGPELGPISREIAAVGIEDVTHLLGARSDVPQLLASSHVFVMSSDHEGLPLSLLEAMDCGLAPVLTPFMGVSDIVDPGKSALVSSSFSPEDLAACLIRVVQDGNLRATLGLGARLAARRFDIARCAGEYELVYKSVMSRR